MPESEQLQADIVEWVEKYQGREIQTGGCKPFYTTQEWRERKEEYGLNSKLIIVHDGGDFARYCNGSYGDFHAIDAFSSFLYTRGLYVESCTCWYSAVYSV